MSEMADELIKVGLKRQMKNARDKRYRDKARETLFDALGRKCKYCGDSRLDKLQFDVVVPVGDPKGHHGRMSSVSRFAFYKREHARKNLQVLCTHCNSSKSDKVDLFLPQNVTPSREAKKVVDRPF